MEWLTMLQTQSAAVKFALSVAVCVVAGAIVIFIWQAPSSSKDTPSPTASPPQVPLASPSAGPPSPAVTHHQTADAINNGPNSGVVAGNYYAAPSTSEAQQELAREQLFELHRRQAEQAAEAVKQAEAEENARQERLVAQLLNEYRFTHDGISPAMAAGIELPPEQWMNERLQATNQPYRFLALPGGKYRMDRTR